MLELDPVKLGPIELPMLDIDELLDVDERDATPLRRFSPPKRFFRSEGEGNIIHLFIRKGGLIPVVFPEEL